MVGPGGGGGGSGARPAGPDALRSALEAATARAPLTEEARDGLIARFGFAVPTDEALACIARHSPSGVVEVGAGCGYWAASLHAHGVDVVAFDPEPAPSAGNPWFAGTEPWHPVAVGDHTVVEAHPDRTLLIVWPTKDETWPADALERYRSAGGACVVYVGEDPGGSTGDDVFHARLGDLLTCAQCAYGVTTVACICDVAPAWRRVESVELPHWPGHVDDLHVYRRPGTSATAGRRRRLHRRRR